jgi:hypothetical protein
MSYVGNTPFTAAFLTDTFSGNGSTVAFTMSVAPANTSSILVAVTGVTQDPSTYSVSGTTLTFSAAPPTGTSNISVRYLGIPASGVTTTAYRTQTEFTATAGQTTFSVPSYTVGFIDVYRNGLLLGSPDFTATNGTTVVLTNAASAGDFVETVSFYVSSVLNALPNTGGTLSGGLIVNGDLTTSGNTVLGDASTDTLNVGNGGLVKDASGNVGIGTASPSVRLHVTSSGTEQLRIEGTTASGYTSLNLYGTGRRYAVGVGNASETSIGLADKFYVYDSTGGATRMVIDSAGSMGLGVTPSAWASNVYRAFELNNGVALASYNVASNVPIMWLGANAFYNGTNSIYKATAAATLYQQNQGTHAWYIAPSGTAGNTISFTQAMTLNANGALALQGASTSANGVGITFPATQSASSDVNTLDDYEEGTFTPTDGSGAGLTFSAVVCTYTKVGNTVTCQGTVTYPATGSGLQARLDGFPFVTSKNAGGFCMYSSNNQSFVLRNQSSSTNTFLTQVTAPGTAVSNASLSGASIQFTYILQT